MFFNLFNKTLHMEKKTCAFLTRKKNMLSGLENTVFTQKNMFSGLENTVFKQKNVFSSLENSVDRF